MRHARRFAAALIASALLAAGYSALFGAPAEAGQDAGAKQPASGVSVEAVGPSEPAQSLSELLGYPSVKGASYITIPLHSNTVAPPGSTFIDKYEKYDLNGYTLTIYGDLTLYGSINVNGGKLIIKRDPKLDPSPSNPGAVNVTGNLIVKGGLLVMQKAADYVETEKSLIADGGNETGALTNGKIQVGAHLLQLDDTSPYSYNETGSHITAFAGAGKLVQFTTPLNSGITNISPATGLAFTAADTDISVIQTVNAGVGDASAALQPTVYHTTGGSSLCLRKLAGDITVSVPNLYFVGALGGHKLSVPGGKVIVPQGAAPDLGAGSVVADGFYVSAGDITAEGQGGADVTISRFDAANFTVAGTSINLSGDIGARNLTVAGNAAIPGGAALTVGGSLTVQPGQELSVGAGRLFVSGNMDVKGLLDMRDVNGEDEGGESLAVVRGAFTAEGADSRGHLTAGKLVLLGDFTQKSSISANSFCADAGHSTLLLGGAQSVSFESPADAGSPPAENPDGKSWFGLLVNCNETYPAGTLPALSETVSSTKLTGFAAEAAGEAVTPSQDPDDKLRYELAIPAGAAAASITPLPAAADEDVTVRIGNSDVAAEGDGNYVIPVTADETTTVTLTVRSSEVDKHYAGEGEPFSTTYTLEVSRRPLLTGITVSYDAGAADMKPVFSSRVHTGYIADVPVDCTGLTVSAEKGVDCKKLEINGQPDTDPFQPDVLPGGWADVTLKAFWGHGPDDYVTYSITVRRPMLSGIDLTAGALTAPFDGDSTVVSNAVIPYRSESVTLQPAANDATGSGMSFTYYANSVLPGNLLPDGTVALAQGESRRICIVASYGGESQTYQIDVGREKSNDATLKSLSVSAGWLSPAFSPAAASYTLTLPETVSQVTLSPAVNEPHSTFRFDTLAVGASRTVSVALNGSVLTRVYVTAYRGNVAAYTVTVRRVKILTSLSARPAYAGYPSLSPGGTNRLKVYYSLALPATVKLEVKKGTRWYMLTSRAEATPGDKSWYWDGKVGSAYLAAGTYTLRATPYYAGKAGTSKTITVKILPKPTVSVVSLSPSPFAANGTNRLKAVVKWTRLTDAKVEVVNASGRVVRTLFSAAYQAPATVTLYWDGRDEGGALVPAGTYRIKVSCGGAAPVYRSFTVKR